MVVDILQNVPIYKGFNERIQFAFKYLQTTNFDEVPAGRYALDGDNVIAIVSEFETKDKAICEIEAHRKYLDIQYIVKGVELFGYAPLHGQIPVKEYDAVNDVAIYQEPMSYIKMEAGMFIIFLPTDLHQPEVREFESVLVKKVVMKIRIDNDAKVNTNAPA